MPMSDAFSTILCTTLATERFTITELLDIVQTASDTTIAVGIECIEIDGRSAVDTAVDFAGIKNRLTVRIYNTRLACGVGVDEVAVRISRISIGTLYFFS